jgi:hypothetical protein
MEHRIHFTRREQHDTLQSHLLVPVSMNGRSGFLFSVEPARSKTLVSARTIETLGINVDDSSSRVTISEKLAYPIVRLDSIGVATATVNAFDVVVWGRPVIPAEILADNEEGLLYHLGYNPPSAITSVIECRGVLGADFLRKFKVSLDFRTDTMVLEE